MGFNAALRKTWEKLLKLIYLGTQKTVKGRGDSAAGTDCGTSCPPLELHGTASWMVQEGTTMDKDAGPARHEICSAGL